LSNAFKKSFNKLTDAIRFHEPRSIEAGCIDKSLPKAIINILEAMPDGTSLHEYNGTPIWISQKTRKMLRVEQQELSVGDFLSSVNPQDKLKFLKVFSDCHMQGSEQSADFRSQFVKESGDIESTIFQLHVSRYDLEARKMYLACIRDVTTHTIEQDRTSEMLEEAQHSSKTKSLFLSNMSHELRTPLNAIIGFSQMLMGEGSVILSDQKKTEYAGLVNQSAGHLLTIINDILDVSRIEAGKFPIAPELLDLPYELETTLQLLQPIARQAGVELVLQIDEAVANLTADPRALRQIIINLVANAIKFSNPGQRVVLRAKRKLKNISFQITDSGLGMDDKTIKQLGSVFYQADQTVSSRHEGAGLGLSIVFGLVKLHKGQINFDSTIGHGTTVEFVLPLNTGATIPVPANPDDEVIFLNKTREPNLLRRLDKTHSVRKVG